MICPETDFMFPMKADLYFPIVTQNSYGQPVKDWVYDRTVAMNAAYVGGVNKDREEIRPAEFLQYESKMVARTKSDPRISSQDTGNAMTNILVTNIRDAHDSLLYVETAGPRAGRGTIYEVATVDPFIGPFGTIEYFKLVLRRSENQSVSD